MKKLLIAAAAAALLPVAAANAQEAAPDGTPAFGIEPYVGVGGGYHDFDRGGDTPLGAGNSANGALVLGFAGVNVPLGPLVVGVEGNVAKGFQDIDWEYGATGHVGLRAGESGLIYVRAGYQWIEGDDGFGETDKILYGVGVEAGPSDIGLGGLTGNAGIRLRLFADTVDFQSIRPAAAVVFHF